MGTASDLLLASEKVVLTIDSSLRTIVIPPNVKNLGVVSDDDVMRVYFTMPKTYCEIDLSTFAIRINYLNAKGGPDLYKVTDATVEDDQIIFSWLVGRNATAFKGNVTFNVCLKDINEEGLVEREFNTTVTTLPILEGLETDEAVIQDHADYIVQLERELTEHIENTVNEWCGEKLDETVVAQKTSEHVLSKVAEDYVPKTDGVIMSDEVVDNSVAYVKDVPATSPNVAKIHKIGGVTRKTKNLWNNTAARLGSERLTRTETGYKFVQSESRGDYVCYSIPLVKGQTVTFSCVSSSYTPYLYLYLYKEQVYGTNLISVTGGKLTYTALEDLPNATFTVIINSDGVDHEVSNIQVEFGESVSTYEPYFDGLRSTPVTEVESVGVNICPPLVKGVRINPSSGIEQAQEDAAATDFIPIDLVNNTYRISGLSEELYSFIAFYDASKTFLDRTGAGTASGYLIGKDGDTYVSYPDRSKYMRITTYETTSTTGSIDLVDDLSLMGNKGIDVIPYSPYTRNMLPIPEAVQALDGYGDGVNESVYNYIGFETKQFVKRVGKVVLDGSADELWGATPAHNTADYNAFYIRQYATNSHKTAGGVALCDKLLNRLYSQWYNNNVDGFYLGDATDKQIIVRVPNTITTAAEMRAWLAESPLTIYYELTTPEVTDISDLFQRDNLLPIEANGTVTMVNEYEYEYDVPSEVIFYTDAPEHVSAKEFVGNLSGTAARAESDVEGNPIPTTYTKKSDSLVDDSTNRVKPVPENSASYAKVNKIGGKTRKCTNILPYPYYDTTTTKGGVTFTDNGDGGIAINGTSTGTLAFYLCSMPNDPLPIGYYSVEANGVCEIRCYHDDETATTFASSGGCIDITKPIVQVALLIREGRTYNGTVYPMLNEGTEPLPYEPYFEGLRSAPVTEVESVGVNLLDIDATPSWNSNTKSTLTKTDDVTLVSTNSNATGGGNGIYVGYFPAGATLTISGYYAVSSGSMSFRSILSNKNATSEANINVYTDIGYSTTPTYFEHKATIKEAGNYYFRPAYSDSYDASRSVTLSHIQINEGSTALPYRPYRHTTLPIPEAVQALDGYGCGLSDTLYNYIDLDAKQFVKRVAAIDMDDMEWNYTDYWASPTLRDTVLINYQNPSLLAENYETHAWTGSTLGQVTMNGTGYIVIKGDSANIPHGMLYYELATPEIIDISIGDAVGVEPGGTVTFVNEYKYDLPNKLTFYTEPNKFRVGSEGFVGDLIGTASRAVCDGEGNDINKTYVKNQSDSFVLKSATKLWRITVDDSGTITATEIT